MTAAGIIDYRDPALEHRAWVSLLARSTSSPVTVAPVQRPAIPENVSAAEVGAAMAVVVTDTGFATSIWAATGFQSLLRGVLLARGNELVIADGVALLTCTDQSGKRFMQVPVTAVATSSRVFFGCEVCGRQSTLSRTEIRNRCAQRYSAASCVSCHALDLRNPPLAALIAPHPLSGIQPDPSTVSVGSGRHVAFHCRAPGCPCVLLRRPKLLARDGSLPVCEAHRARGNNFAGPLVQREGA